MGFLSKLFGGGEKKSRGYKEAIKEIQNLGYLQPSEAELAYHLERLVSQGELDPEMAETILLEQTNMGAILDQIDPRLKEEQYDTLAELRELATADGLDPQAEAMLRRTQMENAQKLQGDIAAIQAEGRRRGQMTTGMEIGNQLLAAQSAANRQSQQDLDIAANARQRAIDAMLQKADLAGSMEDREFDQRAAVAQAQDQINAFNASNRQNVANANVDRINQAQRYNLDRLYDIQRGNIDQSNIENNGGS